VPGFDAESSHKMIRVWRRQLKVPRFFLPLACYAQKKNTGDEIILTICNVKRAAQKAYAAICAIAQPASIT
jgi:hypothetical protein